MRERNIQLRTIPMRFQSRPSKLWVNYRSRCSYRWRSSHRICHAFHSRRFKLTPKPFQRMLFPLASLRSRMINVCFAFNAYASSSAGRGLPRLFVRHSAASQESNELRTNIKINFRNIAFFLCFLLFASLTMFCISHWLPGSQSSSSIVLIKHAHTGLPRPARYFSSLFFFFVTNSYRQDNS